MSDNAQAWCNFCGKPVTTKAVLERCPCREGEDDEAYAVIVRYRSPLAIAQALIEARATVATQQARIAELERGMCRPCRVEGCDEALRQEVATRQATIQQLTDALQLARYHLDHEEDCPAYDDISNDRCNCRYRQDKAAIEAALLPPPPAPEEPGEGR